MVASLKQQDDRNKLNHSFTKFKVISILIFKFYTVKSSSKTPLPYDSWVRVINLFQKINIHI